jgi:hypothetical protein
VPEQIGHGELSIRGAAKLSGLRLPLGGHIQEGQAVSRQEADEHFRHDPSADRPERLPFADQFRLLQDVIPQGRLLPEGLLEVGFLRTRGGTLGSGWPYGSL